MYFVTFHLCCWATCCLDLLIYWWSGVAYKLEYCKQMGACVVSKASGQNPDVFVNAQTMSGERISHWSGRNIIYWFSDQKHLPIKSHFPKNCEIKKVSCKKTSAVLDELLLTRYNVSCCRITSGSQPVKGFQLWV